MFEARQELVARMDRELVGWLTTVSPIGQPQSSVVWFLRDGNDLLVYSQPDATKLSNISANQKIAFALRTDELGDSMATFEGTATVVDSPIPLNQEPAYLAKYQDQMERLGGTPEEFAAEYSALIRISIERVRSF